jgi:DUF438 domain-containing protein
MSEFINNIELKRKKLLEFSLAIFAGSGSKKLISEYRAAIDQVTPQDVIWIVDELVKLEIPVARIKLDISKVIAVFYKILQAYPSARPKSAFIRTLVQENREIEKALNRIKKLLRSVKEARDQQQAWTKQRQEMLAEFTLLQELEKHFLRKENILFPVLEKEWPDFRCVQVMWSLQDDVRRTLKALIALLQTSEPPFSQMVETIGRFFFDTYALLFRENYILLPVVEQTLDQTVLDELHRQSFEIGFTLIAEPDRPAENRQQKGAGEPVAGVQPEAGWLDLQTGELRLEQILLLLNHLPVDITFVDEHDEVRFFSNPKDRFFSRSKAIIGRKVQNCHPPESIHMVNAIVDSFRQGTKDQERFWIQMRGRFILIDYYALRDKDGQYRGTLEVSQDITELRGLSGEKRLIGEGERK